MLLTLIGLMVNNAMPMETQNINMQPSIAIVSYYDYPEWNPDPPIPERPHLTKTDGTFNGPSGTETYYNKDMSRCIQIMRDMGYSEEEYPVYIREDGAKMFGPYVMCAADISWRPKGTILETSLGQAIVVDTGAFRYSDSQMIDMCVDW